MPEPIRRLTVVQFRLLLPDASVLVRTIDAVHVHHTWKPERADFRGLETIEAMRRFHLSQGWSDIAQHLTIDPQGGLWTGRNWNLSPASSKGHNGTAAAGPFMIEIVGNFDTGHDPFDGAQRDSAAAVVGHLLKTFKLQLADIKFHRELNNNQKTCPGSGFDRALFETRVTKEIGRRAPAAGVFPREFLAGAPATYPSAITVPDTEQANATVPEHAAGAREVERQTRSRVARSQRQYSRDFSRLLADPSAARGEDWTELKPHVVNLSRGELSEAGGEFTTSPMDLDGIIDAIRDRASADPSLRILLYAHGGLVGEADALAYAKTMYRWWLPKGVYPVFFVWETGLLETLRQRLFGARDFFDWTSDAAIELAAKGPGTFIWSEMKSNARRASSADLGEGFPGGAYLFASKLAAFLKTDPAATQVTLHAIGHSAGAIFHAHLLPALLQLGAARIETLSLFAPAARTELFVENLLPLIEAKKIARHTCFTMEEDAEEQDDCFKIYRKSLLYFISHAFEGLKRRPIVGLQRSIRKDDKLRAFYGLDDEGRPVPGATPVAEIQFSFTRDKQENPLTRALAHGAFDNDPKTMSAALRRILGVDDQTGLGEADFPFPPLPRTFEPLPMRPGALVGASQPGRAYPDGPPPAQDQPGDEEGERQDRGRRVALCIGIDDYPDRPLDGCVNDANAWGRVLAELGFEVRYLRNKQATNRRIQNGLRDLLAGASAGDVLVFQYAGHGTQLADDSGDEADGFDEAFVPVDYREGELMLLRDDVFATALEGLPAGVTLTLFMDCCHCGTNSRFAPAVRGVETATDRARFMPPDLLGAAREYRSARARSRALPSSAPGVIHLAACRDNEFAWESKGQGDFTGAATAFLAEAVRRGDTNEAFIKQVAKIVAAKKRQHPLMLPAAAGMARRPLLSGAAAVPSAAVPSAATLSEPMALSSIDAQLLAHLEAAVQLLRARVDR
ncbi:MAG TPA: caspase family protein [Vicinamibacterales bacterium]|nr:caspase family protein [Vicinamibacterales bacterium]